LNVRSVLSRLLLAIAVVLFQHGAVAHAFMHAGEHAHHAHDVEHEDDGDFHAPHGCDACHAYLAADSGAPPGTLLVVTDGAAPIPHAPAAIRSARGPPHGFHIRAPPARP
jgi:hypothetical protein